jgi:hypothetical protein
VVQIDCHTAPPLGCTHSGGGVLWASGSTGTNEAGGGAQAAGAEKLESKIDGGDAHARIVKGEALPKAQPPAERMTMSAAAPAPRVAQNDTSTTLHSVLPLPVATTA